MTSGGGAGDLLCEIDGLSVPLRADDLTLVGMFVPTTTPPPVEAEVVVHVFAAPRKRRTLLRTRVLSLSRSRAAPQMLQRSTAYGFRAENNT
jgi:hypothetical protein